LTEKIPIAGGTNTPAADVGNSTLPGANNASLPRMFDFVPNGVLLV
jgi:hypothetical protein